jgi:hypothetical protein
MEWQMVANALLDVVEDGEDGEVGASTVVQAGLAPRVYEGVRYDVKVRRPAMTHRVSRRGRLYQYYDFPLWGARATLASAPAR